MEAGWAMVLCVWHVFAPRRNGGEGVDGDGGFVLGGWRSAGGSRMRACGFGQTESNGGGWRIDCRHGTHSSGEHVGGEEMAA